MVVPFIIVIGIIALLALHASSRRPEDLKGPASTLISFFLLMGGFFFFFGLEHGWERALPWTMALAVSIAGILVVTPSIRRIRGARVSARSGVFVYLFACICAMYAVMILVEREWRLSLILPGVAAFASLVSYAYALRSPHQLAKRRLRNTAELPLTEWKDGALVKAIGTVLSAVGEPLVEGDTSCVLLRAKGVATVEYSAAQLQKMRRSVEVRIPGAGGRSHPRTVHPNQLAKHGIKSAQVDDEIDETLARDFVLDVNGEKVRIDATRVIAQLAHDKVSFAHPNDACEGALFAHCKAKMKDGKLRALRIEKQVLRVGERVVLVGVVQSELVRDTTELGYRGTPSVRSFVLGADAKGHVLITNAEPLSVID